MMHDHLRYTLIGICLLMVIFIMINDSLSKRKKYSLFLMSLFSFLLLVSDKIARTFDGIADPTWFIVIRICKFMAYFTFLLVIVSYCQYLKDLFKCEEGYKCPPRGVFVAECIIYAGIALLVVSQFTGIYYAYDSNHTYVREPLYVLSYILPTLSVTTLVVTIIVCRKRLRKKLVAPLLLFTSLPVFAAIPQFFVHGVSFTSVFMVAMVILLYCFSIDDTNKLARNAHKQEVERAKQDSRNMKLMISQTVEALAEAIDTKDSYTNGHSRRVAKYSMMIAQRIGKTEDECSEIYIIGLLHDIGKIGVPVAIINKEEALTPDEYEKVKEHTTNGKRILSKITMSPNLILGAYCHHERYDGTGYPQGLEGADIPEVARIIAVADAYDAMASKRSYREALPQKKIREELVRGIGKQFDPLFAQIMINIIDEDKYYQLREA